MVNLLALSFRCCQIRILESLIHLILAHPLINLDQTSAQIPALIDLNIKFVQNLDTSPSFATIAIIHSTKLLPSHPLLLGHKLTLIK